MLARLRADLNSSPEIPPPPLHRFFSGLDETHPGLGDQVFNGLKRCAHC